MAESRVIGDWQGTLRRLRGLPDAIEARLREAVRQNAEGLAGEMKKHLLDQIGMKQLSPITVMLRNLQRQTSAAKARAGQTSGRGMDSVGSSKRLINRGDLLGAISWMIGPSGLVAWVGVPDSAKNRSGVSLSKIARLQQTGYVTPVTPVFRRLLAAIGFPLKATTTHLVVPPSPFMDPAIRAYRSTMLKRSQQALSLVPKDFLR